MYFLFLIEKGICSNHQGLFWFGKDVSFTLVKKARIISGKARPDDFEFRSDGQPTEAVMEGAVELNRRFWLRDDQQNGKHSSSAGFITTTGDKELTKKHGVHTETERRGIEIVNQSDFSLMKFSDFPMTWQCLV
ncbi:hypothetical protein CDL15_Pgr027277 [Punica granatum]|uniref:Uncharacterized protein n=1 Tax=Punica granatum TaxID=22663 RepID=A0A218XNH2_PUNGR|nr:hypothetical protein CDL15_Pgr027277 [Punica granatum]